MSRCLYIWNSHEDINRPDGIATFIVGGDEFKLELKNFHQTIIIDSLVKRVYDEARKDALLEAKNAINTIY